MVHKHRHHHKKTTTPRSTASTAAQSTRAPAQKTENTQTESSSESKPQVSFAGGEIEQWQGGREGPADTASGSFEPEPVNPYPFPAPAPPLSCRPSVAHSSSSAPLRLSRTRHGSRPGRTQLLQASFSADIATPALCHARCRDSVSSCMRCVRLASQMSGSALAFAALRCAVLI
eukprot:2049310-Rhodomonas_salina.4